MVRIKHWLARATRELFSLRTKLVAFSLMLVVVPGVVFALLTFRSARNALERAVGRQLAEVADDAADTLGEVVAEARRNVHTWTSHDIMRELLIGDVDKRISRFLGSLLDSDPAYLGLACVDDRGVVVAATDPAALGTSLRERPWFADALRGKAGVIGPHPVRGVGPLVLEIAAPIDFPDEPGRIAGALVLEYDWRRTSAHLEPLRANLAELGSRIDIAVLDGDGVVRGGVLRPELSWMLGTNLRASGWQGAAVSSSLRPRFYAERTVDALVGIAALEEPSPSWRVLVLESRRDALAPVRTMQRRWVLLFLLVMLAGSAVATFFAGRIVMPVRALTRATRELGRFGETRGSVSVQSRDEIGALATAFNAMSSELRRAREDLVNAAKFAFVGELAAGVAHEIRTPLGVLRTSAQVLARSLPADDARGRELSAMMVEEVDRLERVVAGLLELARPHPLEVDAVDLADVLGRAVELVQAQAAERGIEITADLSAAQGPALCDAEQIYQVALNLIFNAVQILERGGRIWVATLPERAGFAEFSVRDDGPGISIEMQERIFSPFFTTREEGTGLGLALVRRVVEAHHGEIRVASRPGEGAEFTVSLPLARGAAGATTGARRTE